MIENIELEQAIFDAQCRDNELTAAEWLALFTVISEMASDDDD